MSVMVLPAWVLVIFLVITKHEGLSNIRYTQRSETRPRATSLQQDDMAMDTHIPNHIILLSTLVSKIFSPDSTKYILTLKSVVETSSRSLVANVFSSPTVKTMKSTMQCPDHFRPTLVADVGDRRY